MLALTMANCGSIAGRLDLTGGKLRGVCERCRELHANEADPEFMFELEIFRLIWRQSAIINWVC